jgi:hypothetical protein
LHLPTLLGFPSCVFLTHIIHELARTGSDKNNSRAVMAIDHTNNGIRSGFILFGFMLIVVVIKFTAPRMEDTPAKCREKIARSTDAPVCAIPLARGG